ncbi:efflux RND transporter periplasmic adaptor subunit [Melioribacter sp. OK-6-Me]|uniref:efflux RND transporter periplasmic adaptor subunit n=1 Tax=unclassified Melioribacter TaxID=2627329 RepID=UPI003EDB6658
MKHLSLLYATIILFVGISCTQEEKVVEEKSVPVKVYVAKPSSISSYIIVTGSLESNNDAVLISKVNETVEDIIAEPGQKVRKGDLLIKLNDKIQRQNYNVAIAALNSAKAQLELTQKEYERQNKLYEENAISTQQFDQIKTTFKNAKLLLEQAEAQAKLAEEQLQFCYVRSPIDGIVASVYVEKNQMVGAGQQLVRVVGPDKMKSKVFVTGSDIYRVKLGQETMIKIPVLKDRVFKGKVVNIDYALDNFSKSVEVEIELANGKDEIKSGMFAEFNIEVEKKEDVITIPQTALIPQTIVQTNLETGLQNTVKRYFVFVVENGKAKLKEVTKGIEEAGRAEITSGLTEGDTIIVVGQNIVKDGQKVNVIK